MITNTNAFMLIFVYCCEYPLGLFFCHLHKSSHISVQSRQYHSVLASLADLEPREFSHDHLDVFPQIGRIGMLLMTQWRILSLRTDVPFSRTQITNQIAGVSSYRIFKFLQCCNVSQSQVSHVNVITV